MITLRNMIDGFKDSYNQCLQMAEANKHNGVFQFNPPLEIQREQIELLESLEKKEKEIFTVCFMAAAMRSDDVDLLEKRLSDKFGKKVVCLPPTIRNIAFFDAESFIEKKFDITVKRNDNLNKGETE